MKWTMEKLGVLMDRIVGERKTVEIAGPMSQRQLMLRPSLAEPDVEIGVRITQYSYKTSYGRWWMPSIISSVYRVVAFAPADVQEKLDPRLFEPLVYPLLCNSMLRDSKFPHVYALHAFLDRMGPFYPTIKCEL